MTGSIFGILKANVAEFLDSVGELEQTAKAGEPQRPQRTPRKHHELFLIWLAPELHPLPTLARVAHLPLS